MTQEQMLGGHTVAPLRAVRERQRLRSQRLCEADPFIALTASSAVMRGRKTTKEDIVTKAVQLDPENVS